MLMVAGAASPAKLPGDMGCRGPHHVGSVQPPESQAPGRQQKVTTILPAGTASSNLGGLSRGGSLWGRHRPPSCRVHRCRPLLVLRSSCSRPQDECPQRTLRGGVAGGQAPAPDLLRLVLGPD